MKYPYVVEFYTFYKISGLFNKCATMYHYVSSSFCLKKRKRQFFVILIPCPECLKMFILDKVYTIVLCSDVDFQTGGVPIWHRSDLLRIHAKPLLSGSKLR
jgi:hypothetical protein